MIEEIEQAIRERLEAAFPQFHVDAFPSNTEDYERLPFHQGVLLFAYTDSDFSEPEGLGTIVQSEVVQFELHLVVSDLRGHSGAYAHLRKLRELLTGFQPPPASGPLYPLSIKFMSVKDNRWTYGSTWACQTANVELVTLPEGPLQDTLTFYNPQSGHTLEVPLNAQA